MSLDRYAGNPILTRQDIPEVTSRMRDVSSVFNPGAARLADETILLLRVQTRGRETILMTARSDDGEHFTVEPRVAEFPGMEQIAKPVYHVYDPRITPLDGAFAITLALDTYDGCLMGIARTSDFHTFEFLGVTSDMETRNGVLFPEKIGGYYARLDRPNRMQPTGGPPTGNEIMFSLSDDLIQWKPVGAVMKGRPRYWDERIGSGPPPVKTRHGWLHIYHGVATHFASASIYQAGVVLLDLDDPSRVIAQGRSNILEPRESYELIGQVPNVVFPSGMTVDRQDKDGAAPDNARVNLYYGGADTCVCLATTTVGDLVGACNE